MYYVLIILKSIVNVRSLNNGTNVENVPSSMRNGIARCGSRFWSVVLVIILLFAICMDSARGDIIATEIMYHPAEPAHANGGEPGEFIELFNSADQPLDLSDYAFDRGITFMFPAGSTVQARSYVVVAKDPQAIQNQHGIVDVFGPYEGALSNSGETVRLLHPNAQTAFSLKYGTHGDWPAAPDGTGHSLVFPDLGGDLDRARDWISSREMGGSPGAADNPFPSGDLTIELIEKGSLGHYFKGLREPSGGTTVWAQPDFVTDNDWLIGPSGYGYSNSQAELDPISTVLSDMRGGYVSVYARIPFQISQSEIEALSSLSLTMFYDDSFVVYLNGVRVAALGVIGDPPAFDQTSLTGSDYPPDTVDLASHIDLLVPGQNVLAIQGHNVGLSNSSDFVLAPVLTATLELEPQPEDLRRQLVVNEVLASHESAVDFVEFFNPTDIELDLGGMWLSDNANDLLKYRIDDDTKVAPHGFIAFQCSDERTGFGLSSQGEAIFLTEANAQNVAASYAWGPQLPDIGVGRFPDCGSNWYYQIEATPEGPNGRAQVHDVVINELMYHDPDEETAEYIEILNNGANEVDLGDWEFIGVEFEFPNETLLGPQSLLVVADDAVAFASKYGTDSPVLGNYGGSLSNGGERISLLNADDIVVDTIQYQDQFPWPVTPDGLGASLERACVLLDFDNPDHWVASPIMNPSPGSQNNVTDCVFAEPASVVINEFFYHPATRTEDDRNQEFIEIHNFSDSPVDISGWVIAGGVLYVFPANTTIAANSHLVAAWNPQRVQQFFSLPGTVYGSYTQGLPNGGGEIQLINAEGRLIDHVSYDDDFPWPSLADGFAEQGSPGYSLERLCPEKPASLAENWHPTSAPTPSFPNGNATCDLPFLVTNVGTLPGTIMIDDSPVVTATLSNGESASQIQSVEIEYWVDDPETIDEVRARETMNDSGIGGDEAANDGVWSVTLAPLPGNAIVRYRILVHLPGGIQATSPSPDRDVPDSHAYFVDPGVTTNLPGIYHLFIASDHWRDLRNWTAPGRVSGNQPNPNWDREVPATFVADGIVYDVWVRHQGSRWNRNNGSTTGFECVSYRSDGVVQVRSWRIQFPSYRNHDGIDVLILQKQAGWPQRVSFKMFELAGVPAPRTSWARFRINGCDYNTDAYQLERPGHDLVARWFEEVGDMFKSQGYNGNEGPWSWGDERLIQGSRNGFTAQQRYEYTYDRTTRKWEGHPDDGREDLVQALVEGLHQARDQGPSALRSWLAANFDVDRVLRYICTINYVGTFDDMFQNHYLYRKADDGKWCIFPWDMDNTLGGAFGEWNANPFRGADQNRINGSSELQARIGNIGNRSGWWNRIKDSFFIAYEQEFLEMFDLLNNTVFEPDNLRPFVEAIAAEGGRSQSQVDSLMNHISRRHDYLTTLVAHWALDEAEGDIAYDSAGVNDAFVIGDPVWQPADGQVDGALKFDGINDYVETDFVLNPADGPFSVLVWVKGGVPGQAVLSQADGANWLCTDSVGGNLMTGLVPQAGRSPSPP
ncbi:MAG: hypothetical protein CEE41_05395, partial [Hadesarchaea archaeon B3_Hades]